MDTQPDLYPGPTLDDLTPTWLCLFKETPENFQWRPDTRSAWIDYSSTTNIAGDRWVQVRRRAPQPSDHITIGEPGFEHEVTYREISEVVRVLAGPTVTAREIAEKIWQLLTQAR